MHDFGALGRTPFALEVDQLDELALVKVAEDLDIAPDAALEDKIEELIAAGARRIVIDLREARFIDSHGLRILVKYELRSRQRGFELDVIQATGQVRRVFETLGVDRLLRLQSDLESLDETGSRA